jgi:hypothetical protein
MVHMKKSSLLFGGVVAFGAAIALSFGALGARADACTDRFDVNRDCKIDSFDVALVIQNFGKYDKDNNSGNNNNNNNNNPTPTPTPSPAATPPSTSLENEIKSGPDLLAYYTFEGTGVVQDSVKTSTTAALVLTGNAKAGQAGKIGKAIRNEGVGHSLCTNGGGSGTTCKDSLTYDFKGPFSLAFWAKFDSTDGTVQNWLARKWIQEKGSFVFSFVGPKYYGSLAHPTPDYLFGTDKNLPDVPHGRSFKTGNLTTLKSGDWNHIVITRTTNPADYQLYINGVLVTTVKGVSKQANGGLITSVMRSANENSSDPAYIGEFKGLLDELIVYEKALTAAEVTTLYGKYN